MQMELNRLEKRLKVLMLERPLDSGDGRGFNSGQPMQREGAAGGLNNTRSNALSRTVTGLVRAAVAEGAHSDQRVQAIT